MCVDLFAVGSAITIPFLHEQIWFDVAYKSNTSYLIVDAFITNDGLTPIDQIRLNFPHYVALDGIEILSTKAVFDDEESFQCSPYNWIGEFQVDHDRKRVNLTLHFDYDDPDRSTGLNGVKPLFKDCPPAELLPATVTDVHGHMSAMQQFDRAALLLPLADPLPGGETGWLRLKVHAHEWPKQADIVPVRTASISTEPSKFISRATILSPSHLRRDLLERLAQPPYNQWYSELVTHGWHAPETLARVEDHRISIVFDQSVDVSHVSSIPAGAFWAAGPTPLPTDTSRCVLHFATGSMLNENRDVVRMARRICDYCRFLMKDPSDLDKAPSIDHLITRFGSTNHEATGVFIDQLIESKVLAWVDPQQRTVAPVQKKELPSGMLALRKRYTNPRDGRGFERAFRELHPFRIAFTLCWSALSDNQQRHAELLKKFVQIVEADGLATSTSRQAIIVSCSECAALQLPAVPMVGRFARELASQLTDKGAFDVVPLNDVRRRRDIMQTLQGRAEQLRSCDELLFWYIGHGTRSEKCDRLQLGATREDIIEWRDIVELFDLYPRVNKVALLDTCYASVGVVQASRLSNCLVWGTTGPNHGAESGGFIGEEDPGEKYPNFTFAATSVLREQSASLPLSFRRFFGEAQLRAIENADPGPPHGKYNAEPMVVDPSVNEQAAVSIFLGNLRKMIKSE